MMCGGDELALRPQVGLVDEDLAAALLDQAGGPRLGHPGAVDVAGLEGGEGVGVVLRLDGHVAAAGGVGVEALLLQPGAQRDVLGVAELRAWRRVLPLRSAALLMSGLTTRTAPPEVAPETMRMASPFGLRRRR